MSGLAYPGGKRFAFTIIDDTDVATRDNVEPVYELLHRLGLRATKTVWPVACPEGGGDYAGSQTLDDPEYLDFARRLQALGFEITWHGATMQSSRRERSLRALDRFHDALGFFPRIHVNHSRNRENLYWGAGRLDDPLLRFLLRRYGDTASSGAQADSEYWWGDRCERHIRYGRNLTYARLDLHRINPSMPYRDPRRPLVPLWFSSADANDADEFVQRLSSRNQARLERSGGFCILSTHFGKGFARGGQVDPRVRACLEELARRPGWFPNAGELLDWLHARRGDHPLPALEWRRMQWQWALSLIGNRLRAKTRRLFQGGRDGWRNARQAP